MLGVTNYNLYCSPFILKSNNIHPLITICAIYFCNEQHFTHIYIHLILPVMLFESLPCQAGRHWGKAQSINWGPNWELVLPSGILYMNEETFGNFEDFSLEFEDRDSRLFYSTVHESKQIKHKDTIKVVILNFLPDDESLEGSFVQHLTDIKHRVVCWLTIILTRQSSKEKWQPCPKDFPIPYSSFFMKLRCTLKDPMKTTKGIENFWLPEMPEKLAENIFTYTTYPSHAQWYR